VFHSRTWLEAVKQTYGYRPVALTTSNPGRELTDGLVFCCVRSWLTGRRLVSFPFSDHCEPLVSIPGELQRLLCGIEERTQLEGCSYAELRPTSRLLLSESHWRTTGTFYIHRLDLRPGARVVFSQFHRDCVQRRIRHAEKSAITITEGRDCDTVNEFYNLVVETRRRHGLLPQPLTWFRNILKCLGESAVIRCAHKDGRPIAAILTLRHGKRLYYKYGASVAKFHKFGAMPYLLWHAIQVAIESGLEELDLGRSDCDSRGLVTFKERWNAKPSLTSYLRSPVREVPPTSRSVWMNRTLPIICKYAPAGCLSALGGVMYRHFA
jgi:Acetyltransferase (GNAT) domain